MQSSVCHRLAGSRLDRPFRLARKSHFVSHFTSCKIRRILITLQHFVNFCCSKRGWSFLSAQKFSSFESSYNQTGVNILKGQCLFLVLSVSNTRLRCFRFSYIKLMPISTSGYHHSLRHVVYYDHVASGKESERMILSPSRGKFTDECQGPAVMFVAVGVHERIQDVDPTSESQERQGRLWTDCSGGFGWKHPMRTRNLTLRGHSDHTAFQGAPVGRWPLLARHLGCALCSRLYQLSKSH